MRHTIARLLIWVTDRIDKPTTKQPMASITYYCSGNDEFADKRSTARDGEW